MRSEVIWRDLFEEPGIEVARVVDQDIDPIKPVDGSLHRVLRAVRVRDVQLHDDLVRVSSERSADLLRVPSCGDDVMAGGERRLSDVDAHAAASARDEPNFPIRHAFLSAFGAETGLR